MILDKRKVYLLMARMQLTIADISKKAGIPRPTLSKALHGARNPKPVTIGRIAVALGVDVLDIVQEETVANSN